MPLYIFKQREGFFEVTSFVHPVDEAFIAIMDSVYSSETWLGETIKMQDDTVEF